MKIKKTVCCFVILLSIYYLMGCTRFVQHSDPFYNINRDDLPLVHLPLIKPIEAKRLGSSSPWSVFLPYGIWVFIPNSQEAYGYNIDELDKFAVENGIIMAYSSYVDIEADAYIQENYYHWFVIVPDKEIAEGFHTEDEFRQYIQILGVEDPDWRTPEDSYEQFIETGCLDWVPDCSQEFTEEVTLPGK